MDDNPLIRICADIQKEIDRLWQREKQLTDELQWYRSTKPAALVDDQQKSEAAAEQLQLEIQALDHEIQENNARLDELAPAIGTLFNPFNWFAKEQVALRRERRQLREIGHQKDTQRQLKTRELETTRARIVQITTDLQRYHTFDFAERQRELLQVKDKLHHAIDRKRRVEEVLTPLVSEMQTLEERKRRVEADLKAAQDFEQRLSHARSSSERARIHEQCGNRFGESSPRTVIFERQKELRQLERDYEKAKRRVEDVAAKAARRIDTIVIDGNNLCYERGAFIGLNALEALLPLLSQTYSVVVVFDSAIRRLLSTDNAGLQKRLGAHAKVHIVASKRQADETILSLADANEFAYVLSNDRFGDFNEKSAVKGGRIIRHEIVEGNIFVHDLQLKATYRHAAGQEARR